MLSIDETGKVSHVDPSMASAVKVPHKRQVLAALRNIHSRTKAKTKLDVSGDVDVVCRFFGITLEQLSSGN